MSSLAVIGTFYRRPWAVPRIVEALQAQVRSPRRVWWIWEDPSDALTQSPGLRSVVSLQSLPPSDVNPLAHPINIVLDIEDADYVTYLADDSLPHPRKYEVMAQALDENPDWGAVYCAQEHGRVGSPEEWLAAKWGSGSIREARAPEYNPFARVDHTQVMHRRCEARWPLSRGDAALSDAHFFRDLVDELGPLMPIPEVLDWTRQLPDGLSVRR